MKRGEDLFGRRLRDLRNDLSPTGLRVATFIHRHRGAVAASSAAQIAARTATSDATVIRTVQALGFTGLPALKQALAVTIDRPSTPADNMRRSLGEAGGDVGRAVDLVLETHRDAISELQDETGRTSILAAVSKLHSADRIVVFGVGPSAHLARYVSLLLVRGGRAARVLDATGIGLADQLLGLRDGDAVLLLAYGQPYPEVSATIGETRRLGLPVVLVTDAAESRVARHADVVIRVQRGRAEQVALHAATLACLEAVVLGLAAADPDRVIGALDRLGELRGLVVRKTAGPARRRMAK